MKKIIIYIGIALLLGTLTNETKAQIVNSAYQSTDISQKKPMPLPSVREADVFWSKKIWRIIDLREKMNLPLYFPTTEMDGKTNLISLLLQGIENELFTPYDARLDDDFKVPMT